MLIKAGWGAANAFLRIRPPLRISPGSGLGCIVLIAGAASVAHGSTVRLLPSSSFLLQRYCLHSLLPFPVSSNAIVCTPFSRFLSPATLLSALLSPVSCLQQRYCLHSCLLFPVSSNAIVCTPVSLLPSPATLLSALPSPVSCLQQRYCLHSLLLSPFS